MPALASAGFNEVLLMTMLVSSGGKATKKRKDVTQFPFVYPSTLFYGITHLATCLKILGRSTVAKFRTGTSARELVRTVILIAIISPGFTLEHSALLARSERWCGLLIHGHGESARPARMALGELGDGSWLRRFGAGSGVRSG